MSIARFTEPNEDGERTELPDDEDIFPYALMVIYFVFLGFVLWFLFCV